MKTKLVVISVSIIIVSGALYLSKSPGPALQETEKNASSQSTALISPEKKQDEVDPSTSKMNFPVTDGWPLKEEHDLGVSEQRMILARATGALEGGIISQEEFEEYVIEEKRILLEFIQNENESPAERDFIEGEI